MSHARFAWRFGLACALVVACGDDGTEGLSSCPEGKIELDKNNVLQCAPAGAKRAGASGSSLKTGAAGAKSTGANMQANTGTSPAPAGSSASGAANGGPAGTPPAAASGKAPAVPSGPWSCLQYMDACSCVPSEGLGDSCTKPHPPCCTYVTMDGKIVACVCVPAGSAQCTGMKNDPALYPSASKCPP